MALIVGRWLYTAYQWIDPPGAPRWRLYAIVIGLPVLLLALIEGLQLAHVVAAWSALLR